MLCNCYTFNSFLRMPIKRYSLKSLITGATRSVFRTLPGNMPAIDPFDGQGNPNLLAKHAAMPLERVSGRLHAMVNMNGLNLSRPLFGTGQQQGGGICAATERHSQWQGGRKGAHNIGQSCSHAQLIAAGPICDYLAAALVSV
jgi:hypothetical protein